MMMKSSQSAFARMTLADVFAKAATRSALLVSSLLLLLLLLPNSCYGDIEVVNDLIKPDEIYDFVYSTDSTVNWREQNVTKYYCVFRNLWTKERHPHDFPKAARWTNNALYSTTKDWRPWLKNRATTVGIETIVEVRSLFVGTFSLEKHFVIFRHLDGINSLFACIEISCVIFGCCSSQLVETWPVVLLLRPSSVTKLTYFHRKVSRTRSTRKRSRRGNAF